jgi:preprotein translocase subunit SecF
MHYSINDTILIFDRIRENLNRFPSKTFEQVANMSINQTLARSLNTTFTTIIPLVAIFIIGGASLQSFVLALIVGIVVGAYSSIFIASPVLVIWQNFIDKKKLNN